ncbi:MAG: type 4a pilus biogenesis protein PilO [Omnitrophica bacterium]|nr:type 4a pilus biogenesis protein PilO [Candidatus Omnitrophota bacterium]
MKKVKDSFVNSPWAKALLGQYRHQITCSILILISLLYSSLFLLPKAKALFLELAKSTRLKAEIVNIEKNWANLSLLKEKIGQLDQKAQSYEKKLPGEKEIPAVLEYLSDSAKKFGVRITEIRPVEQDKGKDAPPAFYYKAPIMLKAECGYHQLGRFLNELENADRFMEINDLKIVTNPRKSNIHYIQLIVVTYVMKK